MGSSELLIRWLIRRDMCEVVSIETESYDNPWSEEDFLCCLRQRNCIGMVAERNGRVVGFMIYELHKAKLRILNFAVAEHARMEGVGTRMIKRLVDKLSQQRRKAIDLIVRERNLDAQLFFKSQGFVAHEVLRGHYEDEDAYYMNYQLTNRISQYENC